LISAYAEQRGVYGVTHQIADTTLRSSGVRTQRFPLKSFEIDPSSNYGHDDQCVLFDGTNYLAPMRRGKERAEALSIDAPLANEVQ
jgi:hypothetical protein